MIDYTPTPDFYKDYIEHHGILGMKWGKKNGPPYPLDSSVSTGSRLKKSGLVKKKSNPGSIKVSSKVKKTMADNLTDDIKNNHSDNPNAKKFKDEQVKTLKTIIKDQPSKLSDVSKSIASEMAKDMISDFNQWAKTDGEEGIDKYLWSKGKKLTKKQMQDHLQKGLEKNLNKITEDSVFKFKDGSYNITINGLEEYSDGQPLYVNYDPKTKKIRDWGYV